MPCFSCCRVSDVQEFDLNALMLEKLEIICGTFNDVRFPCIIAKDGSVVSSIISDDILNTDVTTTISTLKSTAIRFSTILNVNGFSSLKVFGENCIFLLFMLDSNFMLAFYCTLESDVNSMSTKEAEIKSMVAEIKLVLIEQKMGL